MRPLAGQTFEQYQIVNQLGTGGSGEVYRATDLRLKRDVAIKILRDDIGRDPRLIDSFKNETRAASLLNHPNIITIHDVGTMDSTPYIAMELVEGKTLRQLLTDGTPKLERVLEIGTQIADGLTNAHEAGIVHRDLKPENLMVTESGLVKIDPKDVRHVIGVLPFADISPDKALWFFSEGITEELRSHLYKLPTVRLLSRYASAQSEMARNRPDNLIEGSVRCSPGSVRVTAAMVDARTDLAVWSAQYDRPLQDILAVQTEVALRIVEELRPLLCPAHSREAMRAIFELPASPDERHVGFERNRVCHE